MTIKGFKGNHTTSKLLDVIYFAVVTLSTVGYGDIVPDYTMTKLLTNFFILVGCGIIETLMNLLLTDMYVRLFFFFFE